VENVQSATRAELIEIILRQRVDMALLLEHVESLQGRVEALEAENLRLRRGQARCG
jgi:hypothetical protein